MSHLQNRILPEKQFRDHARKAKAAGFRPAAFLKLTMKDDYFLSASFLGLHFSQTFLFLAASTQHLCVHSLPAFLASSQQLAWTLMVPAKRPRAATRDNILMLFILPFVVVCHLQITTLLLS
jgi:hypothetical protein